MPFLRFLADCIAALRGGGAYARSVGLLLAVVAAGAAAYALQLTRGLVVTGMSDQVSWGFYIANFAFLVGIAAAAVLLVIPAYVFHRDDAKSVVVLGEALAVAAVIGAMTFVLVDLGRPGRFWHMLPLIGRMNFPRSLLAWDVLVLTGYLLLNLGIPGYLLYCRYRGRAPVRAAYVPFVLLSIGWAISIHTVTAFLFAASSARPYWNIAILAPRFIATAFVSGPALIILTLKATRRQTGYDVPVSAIDTLALTMMFALQISLFFVCAEAFTAFYNEGWHAASLRYLYFGLPGGSALRGPIWFATACNVVAVLLLSLRRLRGRAGLLNLACVLAFTGIWIEKGLGLVIPGFVPTPLGEVYEYHPTAVEYVIAAGIWALVVLVYVLFARIVIAIERGAVIARQPA